MTIGERLKLLRNEIGISQEAMGAQGFVSTQGWIKVENGQRSPSEELLYCVIAWLIRESYLTSDRAATLLEELLTLKYVAHNSSFIRRLAFAHAKYVFAESAILVSEDTMPYKRTRRRRKAT